MSASLTITKHDGALDAQTVTVKVENNAKLSALRAFAEGQGLMSSRDLFNIANTSVSLRKASEERLLWTDIQDPEVSFSKLFRSVWINSLRFRPWACHDFRTIRFTSMSVAKASQRNLV